MRTTDTRAAVGGQALGFVAADACRTVGLYVRWFGLAARLKTFYPQQLLRLLMFGSVS